MKVSRDLLTLCTPESVTISDLKNLDRINISLNFRKKKQEEEEAELNRKNTDAAFQGTSFSFYFSLKK